MKAKLIGYVYAVPMPEGNWQEKIGAANRIAQVEGVTLVQQEDAETFRITIEARRSLSTVFDEIEAARRG